MNKEINEIIDNLEQTLGWCDRITTGNLPHKIGNLKQCLVSTIELLKVLNLGWHPASEPPKEDGTYYCLYGIMPFYATYKNGKWIDFQYDWQSIKIDWWCYPPEEYKAKP